MSKRIRIPDKEYKLRRELNQLLNNDVISEEMQKRLKEIKNKLRRLENL